MSALLLFEKKEKKRKEKQPDLLLHGKNGIAGVVEEDSPVPEAKHFALHLERHVAVHVRYGEVAIRYVEGLLYHREIHGVLHAELRAHHHHGAV